MSYFLPIDKEEQLVVVLALYILERLGVRSPKKIQVLRFIKARQLITFYDDDSALRSTGEEKWMNDFAWAREDAKQKGLLQMPEVGIWRITETGKSWLVERAKRWSELYEKNSSSSIDFLTRCRRVNKMTFTHMILIGRGIDVGKMPTTLPDPQKFAAAPSEPYAAQSANN